MPSEEGSTMSVSEALHAPSRPSSPAPTGGSPLGARVLAVLLMGALGAMAVAAGMWLSGCRWFVVETPSMAETAPVGTLVLTAPSLHLRVGDVIAFRPPGLDRVYTHRIVEVTSTGAVRTRGDLNGAEDAWTTPPDRVVGRAVALVPGVGFLARAVPLLIGGALLIWWASGAIRRPDRRAAFRILALHLLVSLVLLFLHPLASISLLATETDAQGVRGSVVSTGLLPVALTSPSGSRLAVLHDGQLATVPLEPNAVGHLAVGAVLDLTWLQHLLLIAITLVPAAAVLLIGLPRGERRPDEDRERGPAGAEASA